MILCWNCILLNPTNDGYVKSLSITERQITLPDSEVELYFRVESRLRARKVPGGQLLSTSELGTQT